MTRQVLIPLLICLVLVGAVFVSFEQAEAVMEQWLNSVRNQAVRYAGISWLVLMSDIVLPVPSSVVMYLNGAVLGLWAGAGLSLASLMVSAMVGYGLGMLAAGRRTPLRQEKTEALIRRYGMVAIVLTRGIPMLSESVCIVAGYNRLHLRNYLILNLIGYAPVCVLYAFFGSLSHTGEIFLYAFFASLLLSGICWLLGRQLFRTFDLTHVA